MLKGNIRLFRVKGIPVIINWSWLFVFVLDQERLVGLLSAGSAAAVRRRDRASVRVADVMLTGDRVPVVRPGRPDAGFALPRHSDHPGSLIK